MSHVILGHYPQYIRASDSLGLRHFELSLGTWNSLHPTQAWLENRHFLDRALQRRDRFVYSHSPLQANPGSSYARELRYLHSKGVTGAPTRSIAVHVT